MAYINDELNSKIRHEFYMFFYRSEENELPIGSCFVPQEYKENLPCITEFQITDFIATKVEDNNIRVELCLHRPGLLIGKRGYLIDAIQKYLKEELNENITFFLFESTMWYHTTKNRLNIQATDFKY